MSTPTVSPSPTTYCLDLSQYYSPALSLPPCPMVVDLANRIDWLSYQTLQNLLTVSQSAKLPFTIAVTKRKDSRGLSVPCISLGRTIFNHIYNQGGVQKWVDPETNASMKKVTFFVLDEETKAFKRFQSIKKAADEAKLKFLNAYFKATDTGSAQGVGKGDAAAQNSLGACYYNGTGVAKDMGAAIEWFRKAAEQGSAAAQNVLGFCYRSGIGVAKDEGAAVEWYQKAAAQGYALAQHNLGFCYQNGTGVVKDEGAAVEWYRKAAEQGCTTAQHNLGFCYEKGTGVAKDEGAAVEWYRKAAEQGCAATQNNLGACYQDGTGVAKDMGAAVEWYRKAAEQGCATAQYNLGICYQNGTGVPKDMGAAIEWLRKAAEQGHAEAQRNLEKVKKHLPEPAEPSRWAKFVGLFKRSSN